MCDAILNGIHKIIGPVCYTQNSNYSMFLVELFKKNHCVSNSSTY